MQTGMRSSRKPLQSHVDIVTTRSRQRRYSAIADFPHHGAHAFQISARSDREAGLNNVHAKRFKLPGHPYFFRHGHGESRRLFPIPQRGIEDAYDVHRSAHSPTLSISSQRGKRVKFIILVTAIKSYYREQVAFGFVVARLFRGGGFFL